MKRRVRRKRGANGAVHVEHGSWTDDDGKLHEVETFNYRFTYKRIQPYKGGGYKTWEECDAAGQKRLGLLMAGFADKAEDIPWEAILERIVKSYAGNKKVHSIRSVKDAEKRLAANMVSVATWDDLTSQRLKDYVGQMRSAGYSDATIGNDMRHLRRVMKAFNADLYERTHGQRQLYIPTFPFDILQPKTRDVLIHPHELARIIECFEAPAPGGLNRPDCVAAVIVAVETSWRMRSEVLPLQWKHIDFGPAKWMCEDCNEVVTEDECKCKMPRPGWIVLEEWQTKNKKPRRTPMTLVARRALVGQREYVDALQERLGHVIPWVCPSRFTGDRMKQINGPWIRAMRKLGLTGHGKTLHSLRKTAITKFKANGVPDKDGMAMSGHLTKRVYDSYHVIDETSARMAIRRLARADAIGSNVIPMPKKEQA